MDFVRQRYQFNMMSRKEKQTLAGRLIPSDIFTERIE